MKRHTKKRRLNAFLKAAQDVSLFPELPPASSYLPAKGNDVYADARERLNKLVKENNDSLQLTQIIASPMQRRINSFYRNQKRITNSKNKIFSGFYKVGLALENAYQTLGLNG